MDYRHFLNVGIRMVETTYYEQKTFWGMEDYSLRSENGFTTLVNLHSTIYALLSMLPFLDQKFESLIDLSIQERRFKLGEAINKKLILSTFVENCESLQNYDELEKIFESMMNNALSMAI